MPPPFIFIDSDCVLSRTLAYEYFMQICLANLITPKSTTIIRIGCELLEISRNSTGEFCSPREKVPTAHLSSAAAGGHLSSAVHCKLTLLVVNESLLSPPHKSSLGGNNALVAGCRQKITIRQPVDYSEK